MDSFGVRKMKKVLTREDIYYGSLLLVNPSFPLQRKILSSDLEIYSEEFSKIKIQKIANKFLQFILREIDARDRIVPVSGYRTLEEQKTIWNDSLKENGEEFTRKYVALPNSSEHQTGLAIDLGLNEGEIDFIRPSFPSIGICNQFREYARRYGFIERYKEDTKEITSISAEEWHFRYVGYPHSEIIEYNHFCLEEYIEYIRQYRYQENPLVFKNYEISYLPYQEDIEIELENVSISGNNIDGFIITRKIS